MLRMPNSSGHHHQGLTNRWAKLNLMQIFLLSILFVTSSVRCQRQQPAPGNGSSAEPSSANEIQGSTSAEAHQKNFSQIRRGKSVRCQ